MDLEELLRSLGHSQPAKQPLEDEENTFDD